MATLLNLFTIFAQSDIATEVATSGAGEFWVFWVVAPLSLAAALCVVIFKNPIHAALMLVVNFFTVAIFYAVLEGQFLATIQVIVYAGAIVILFLFVLMMLGAENAEETPNRLPAQNVVAVLAAGVLFGVLAIGIASPWMGTDSACNSSDQVRAATASSNDPRSCTGLVAANVLPDAGNPEGIGLLMFTKYVWPFEVTCVVLVVAAIGAMVLGRQDDPLSELVDGGEGNAPGVPHRLELAGVSNPLGNDTAVTDTHGTGVSAGSVGLVHDLEDVEDEDGVADPDYHSDKDELGEEEE